jgi:SAM-dependent methyltransferase
MADGRDVPVWDNHAQECRDSGRQPAKMNGTEWLRVKVLELTENCGVKSALDVGCGPGFWIHLFDDLDYTGLDQSPEMLRLAKDLSPQAAFVLGNGRAASECFPNKKFDLVFTSSVLQHNRDNPDKVEVLSQIRELLCDRGYFLCTENTWRASNYPAYREGCLDTDGYSHTPLGWERLMNDNGFEMLEYNGASEYLFRKK